MVVCFAVHCSHRSGREKCSFFKFPRDQRQFALWRRLARRGDKNPTFDSRLCSCHFKDGKKENGPSNFYYRIGKKFEDFQDPERYRKKVLAGFKDAPNPDMSPSLNLEQFFDSARKLRKRKKKNKQNCPCCDEITPCNMIHKKDKSNAHQKNTVTDNKTSSVNKNVHIVEMKDGNFASSSAISESNSNSGGFHLMPIKIGNSVIYKYLPATASGFFSSAMVTEKVLLSTSKSENSPWIITNYIPSTTLTPADILSKTDKFGKSRSVLKLPIKIKSEETLTDNLKSVQENDLHESNANSVSKLNISSAPEQINSVTPADILSKTDKFGNSRSLLKPPIKIQSVETLTDNLESVQENYLSESDADSVSEYNISSLCEQINNVTTPADILFKTDKFINSPSVLQSTVKIKSEETLVNNLESVQENDLHESDANSDSESNISSASEEINNVTHAKAFCAAETLLHYMINMDDVNSADINFILTLAQKIKERLSEKEENVPENL